MKKWSMKPVVYSGIDSLERLEQFENERILFIFDPFLKGSSILDNILSHISKSNQNFQFSDIVPEPPIETIIEGFNQMKENQPTIVVAIGGGSGIDTAKAMIFFYKKLSGQGIKRFIAIPTTSGTGSEVTSVSVISDTKNKIKYPIFDESLLPDEALLDEELVVSSPKSVTIYSGLDVLTHALEAVVATNRSAYSDALALSVINTVFRHLVNCVKAPSNLYERKQMHQASCLAGLAFDIAGLGICHSLAHQVGAKFKVPHGLANAMLLPYVIRVNASKDKDTEDRYANVSRKIGLSSSQLTNEMAVEKLAKAIDKLARDLETAKNLKEFGIDSAYANKLADEIAQNAKQDATYRFNPVEYSNEELKNIYKNIIA